jgi:hypothetical protein
MNVWGNFRSKSNQLQYENRNCLMSVLLKYPKCLLSAAILLAGLFMGVVKRNDLFGDGFLWIEGLFILIPLTLLLGLIALGVFLWKRRIGRFFSYGLAIGCSCIVSIQIFSETGIWINRWKVDAVESYVARAVPILDQIKQKEGAYPANLPTDLLGEPPELLRDYGDYSATRSSFRFEYVDEPAEWAGGEGEIEFDNVNREWKDE